MSRSVAYIALPATMLLWGLSFVGTKLALLSFPPFTLMFFRFALASVFFLLLFLVKGFPRVSGKGHLKLLSLSIFEPILYFVFETWGLSLTSASESSLIIALVPVAVAALARIFLGERLSARALLGIGLSILGVGVLVFGGEGGAGNGGHSLKGNLLILGAVFSAAVYMVLARDLARDVPSWGITGFQIFYGALFFAPFHFLGPKSAAPVQTSSVGALIYLAAGATVGGFLSYNYALSKVSATKASIFINGIPVVTALGAWAILGERLTTPQLLGAALVIAAVSITGSSPEIMAEKAGPGFVA